MAEYGTTERLNDLWMLASNSAYQEVPYDLVASTAQEVAADPSVVIDDAPSNESEAHRKDQVFDLLMSPYYEGEMNRSFSVSARQAGSHVGATEFYREEAIRNFHGMSRQAWDAMNPWEQAYREQEYFQHI